jgi:hypothetical protein
LSLISSIPHSCFNQILPKDFQVGGKGWNFSGFFSKKNHFLKR